MALDVFEKALQKELSSIPAITNKVLPMQAPKGTTTPFVVYAKSRGDYVQSLDGISRLRDAIYEIDILTETYQELQPIYQSIKDKIASMSGRAIGGGPIFCQAAFIMNMNEFYEDQVRWYRLNVEARFYFNEGV